MAIAALSLYTITTQARICTRPPSVEWNARSIRCRTFAAVNNTTCQVVVAFCTFGVADHSRFFFCLLSLGLSILVGRSTGRGRSVDSSEHAYEDRVITVYRNKILTQST